MKDEIYMMFCDLIDSLWIGFTWGVRIAVAAVVIFWSLKGLSAYSSALEGLVQ